MGRKNKHPKKCLYPTDSSLVNHSVKLSPLKRNELNQLVEKLLKVSSNVVTTQTSWESHLELDKILTKIILIESDLSCTLPTRNSVCAQILTEWVKQNGAVINGVEIAEFDGLDYGLKMTKDVPKYDLIVTIPRRVMLTSENSTNSELGPLAAGDPMLQHMPNVTLALVLLIERFKKDSYWSPYVNMLPSTYNTVMYFTLDHFKELKGSPTFEAALKHCKNIARQYAYFYSIFQRSESVPSQLKDVFTYEHYRWAVSTVMTRQNFVPSDTLENSGMVHALIPFWDMANHTNAKDNNSVQVTTDFNVVKGESECYSCRDFKEGEQFLMSYGARPNHDLFLHNGFVFLDNEEDVLKIQLGVSKADPLHEKRCRLLQALALQPSAQFSLLASDSPLHPHLVAFLRVFTMDEENLDRWLASENISELEKESCAQDVTLENKMWNFLVMRVKLLLSTYPTTLEDDERLLSTELDPCLRLAVLQRLTEKKILKNTLEYAQLKIQ